MLAAVLAAGAFARPNTPGSNVAAAEPWACAG
jgi:hypothetical protein